MAKILLIDDEEQVLKSVGMLLEAQGHEVIPIRDSEKAEEAIRNLDCDLIVTDIRMSPVDGMQLLMLAEKVKPDVPAIVISAYTSEHTVKHCMDIGCKAYIKKPFQVQEVLDAVNSCLVR
ncbi:MAG: response regulator [Verrucomicrobiota bacterium]